jgi:hypothetical protein
VTPPSVLSKLSEGQRLLDGLGRQRRRGERIVEPRPEAAIDEQVHPQQGDEIRERPAEARFQLQVLQDQERDQRRPDLNVHRWLTCQRTS